MGILYPSGNKKLLVLSKYEIKDVILPVDINRSEKGIKK